MTLQDLREEVEAQEVEAVEPEVEAVESQEAETVEDATEVDEIELEIEGEEAPKEQKRTPQDALVYKLTKEKKKRKEADSQVDELQRKVEELEARLQAPKQAPKPQQASEYPPVPVLYEDGISTREQYNQAYAKWMNDCKAVDQRKAQQSQQRAVHAEQAQQRAERLAERASGFIDSNKLKADKAIDHIQEGVALLDQAAGLEGAGLILLDSVGEGAEKVAYHLSRNKAAMSHVTQLLKEDPNGLKATAWLTKQAEKLKPKKAHISNAPAPDEPLSGDGATATESQLQAQYAKETDVSKLIALKRQARKLGIKLD